MPKDSIPPTGLDLLRQPFPAHQISKLPKPTKKQTEEVRADFKKGIRCTICGQWHHPNVVHLDYVGHAALTDRLLDCDPEWNWTPAGVPEGAPPELDANGGMWIRLTVCGVTRLGYGHPDGKKGGDAIKETIGDALRNAAMRFGAALDLWHKGELHPDDDSGHAEQVDPQLAAENKAAAISVRISQMETLDDLRTLWANSSDDLKSIKATAPSVFAKVVKEKDEKAASFAATPADDLQDEIPY